MPNRLLILPPPPEAIKDDVLRERAGARIAASHIVSYDLQAACGNQDANLTLVLSNQAVVSAALPALDAETCGYLLTVLDDWFGGERLPDGKPQPHLLDLADLAAYVRDPANIALAQEAADEMMVALALALKGGPTDAAL